MTTPTLVISTAEPPATYRGLLWLRQTPDGNSFQLYARNTPTSPWLNASAGLGSGDYGDGFDDGQDRQVGYFDIDNGEVIGLQVQVDGRRISLRTCAMDGSDAASVRVSPGLVFLTGGRYRFANLPTSDPHDEGVAWNDGGSLRVSAG